LFDITDFDIESQPRFFQISSLILFVGILKFVKLLRFNNRFAVLILTLKTAWEDLLGFFAVFFLVFFAFVQVLSPVLKTKLVSRTCQTRPGRLGSS
jgi:hypothetical protein